MLLKTNKEKSLIDNGANMTFSGQCNNFERTDITTTMGETYQPLQASVHIDGLYGLLGVKASQ